MKKKANGSKNATNSQENVKQGEQNSYVELSDNHLQQLPDKSQNLATKQDFLEEVKEVKETNSVSITQDLSQVMQFQNSQDESKILNAMASKNSSNQGARKSATTEFYSVSQNMPAQKFTKTQSEAKQYQIVQEKLYESSDPEQQQA